MAIPVKSSKFRILKKKSKVTRKTTVFRAYRHGATPDLDAQWAYIHLWSSGHKVGAFLVYGCI